jgi:hypothetical protein
MEYCVAPVGEGSLAVQKKGPGEDPHLFVPCLCYSILLRGVGVGEREGHPLCPEVVQEVSVEEFSSPIPMDMLELDPPLPLHLGHPFYELELGLVLCVQQNGPAKARGVIDNGEPVPVPLQTCRERTHKVDVDPVQKARGAAPDEWVGHGLGLALDARNALKLEGSGRCLVHCGKSHNGLLVDESLNGGSSHVTKSLVKKHTWVQRAEVLACDGRGTGRGGSSASCRDLWAWPRL